jgi:hypothetical protein
MKMKKSMLETKKRKDSYKETEEMENQTHGG